MLHKLLQIYGSFIKKDTGKTQESSKHRQERKLQISRYMLYMKIFLKCVYLLFFFFLNKFPVGLHEGNIIRVKHMPYF